MGANGQGKTTLLKLITGELKNQLGTVFIHRRIRFATFSQHHVDQLNMSLSPLEFFTQNFPGKEPQEYRSHLGRYVFCLAIHAIWYFSRFQLAMASLAILLCNLLTLWAGARRVVSFLLWWGGSSLISSFWTRFAWLLPIHPLFYVY